jgi:2-oxoglutarate dehydrogenase E1 component
VLRRQIRRNFRKPLIVMAPKSLLRHKLVVSKLEEFGPGASFHRVLWDLRAPKDEKQIRRVVLCSGKVYYDLHEEAEKRGTDDVQILRLEQLYPFPRRSLTAELGRFPNVEEVIWCQEEPENMGAWNFVDRRIEAVLAEMDLGPKRPVYVGRPEAASPATGSLKKHIQEQEALVDRALTID